MPGRILVIRGGAIGDFILTLPALGLLREGFPDCHLEIVGYRHICALAEKRYYADATRSIEYAPMAGFFNPRSELDAELCSYFSSFQQIVSYIYDPDELFASCLRRAGVKNLLVASPLVTDADHATYQLARPLQSLALYLDDPTAVFYPSPEDIRAADALLEKFPAPYLAVHPGSGGEQKNWPVFQWQSFIDKLSTDPRIGTLLVIGGESDRQRLAALKLPEGRALRIEGQPLCTLGAVLARCPYFIGHDSGISHLAAAAGARCLLLFGPTDPEIWAPKNDGVTVLRHSSARLDGLEVRDVAHAADHLLSHG